MEVNILQLNKKTLNSGYIFFINHKKFNAVKDEIKKFNIGTSELLFIKNGVKYYGLKLFYIKKNLLELCGVLEEVINND